MKATTLVLVTFLGLAAWAGNGFERGYFIDFGSYKLSDELKGRLSQELADACPDLVISQEAGPVARITSATLAWHEDRMVYKIGLSLLDRSFSPPAVTNDRMVEMVLVKAANKTWPWLEPQQMQFETACQ